MSVSVNSLLIRKRRHSEEEEKSTRRRLKQQATLQKSSFMCVYCAQPGEDVGMEREVSAIITVQSLRHIALISIQRYSTVLLHRGCEKIPGQL